MAVARLPDTDEHITRACREVALSLGYPSLKEGQQKVIVQGEDVFAVLPTGFGKSLCYMCLPGVFDALNGSSSSVVVVITAIIKDQVCSRAISCSKLETLSCVSYRIAKFSERGLRVAYMRGEQDDEEVKKGVVEGYFQLVFFTPEVLLLTCHWRQPLGSPVYSRHLREGPCL